MRFNAKAMALLFAYNGCIKWIVVHPSKPEVYTLWSNGGTIKEMLSTKMQFNCKDVYIIFWIVILTQSNDDYQKMIEVARHVELFRKKCHNLAWTLSNTMNNVHHYHILYNDISPDNIMLQFLPNFLDKIYIGTYNGAMAGNFNDLKESFYIYKNDGAKSRIMWNRWQVALELNYILPLLESTKDVQFKKRPKSTLKSETFAMAKLQKQSTMATSFFYTTADT